MLDNGYAAHDAARLVHIQEVKRGRRLSNLGAMPSIRQILRDYEDALIDGMEAARRLTPLVVDPGQRQQMLAASDDRVRTRIARAAVKRAKRAFIIGEWDSVKADQFLAMRGLAPPRIQELLIEWRDEMQGRLKEPTAKLIVQWAEIGLIMPDDAYRRLLRLGYVEIDATRIVYQGIYARNELIDAKIDKRKKEIKSIIKDAKQAKKEEEKALKDRQKEIEKQMTAMEKEQKRIQTELEDRAPKPEE